MISIWEKETFFAPQDVIIIGSGLVGLWSAFYLKKKHPKLKITIIDRGIIPTGASTRNAGFACFGSLSELVADSGHMGNDKLLNLVEMRYKGLKRIQKYFKADAIDFALCGGYELYDTNENLPVQKIESNIEYINTLLKEVTGTKKTFKLVDEEIADFGFANTSHLVKNKLEGYLHSGKLIQSLQQRVLEQGVQIFGGIEVKNFDLMDDSVELTTNRNISFCCNELLICTNAFAKDLLPTEVDVVPARGQVLLTSPIKHLPWCGTFHADEGYYYFRNLGDKVLLGGARNKAFKDEETTDLQTTDFIQQALEKYLDETILPNYRGQYVIEQRWSGIMAMGADKTPIVKKIMPHIYCAVRMSGMGVALSPVIGQEVADLLFD